MIPGPLQLALERRIMTGTTYRGVPALKMPMDAWVYQEIIHETRPDFIVEIGNNAGGALLYLADLCELAGRGTVIGVDEDHTRLAHSVWLHPRIEFVTGDAVEKFADVKQMVGRKSCLVIEDSAHTEANTLAVMRAYGRLVKVGGYMIVEDGVMPEVDAAIAAFLDEQTDFEIDSSREWPVTWNPAGYLRRVR